MGTRFYCAEFDDSGLSAFDARLRALLDIPLSTEGDDLALTPPTLCLSGAAKRDWISYHDDVERELGRTGDFGNVQDFAAKTAESAARIAALLHIFEHGPGGEISQDLMQAGAALASWHLFEAKRIIGATEAPESISNARLLLDWIIAQGPKTITPRYILQFAPSRLRDRRRRDAALRVLLDTFHLSEESSERGMAFRLHPKLGGQNVEA
jgi:putative DNA primase/helicase